MKSINGSLLLLIIAYGIFESVQAQDQSGFISLDCGLIPTDTTYVEKATNITYKSDADYVDSGSVGRISEELKSKVDRPVWTVRSFADGQRNCYNLVNLTVNSRYLIRGSFMYGNYDGLKKTPSFDLYIGPNIWTSVLASEDEVKMYELIHFITQDRLQICLVKTGETIPFISSLELRPLPDDTYVMDKGSLILFGRYFFSWPSVRYDEDIYDRIWEPSQFNTNTMSTVLSVDTHNSYNVPQPVATTAAIPKDPSQPLTLNLTFDNPPTEAYVYMHFVEIQDLKDNETRTFDITYNDGQPWFMDFSPLRLSATTIYGPKPVKSFSGNFIFSFEMTGNSTLPPLINGFEIYKFLDLGQLDTDQEEAYAMVNIKKAYQLNKKISWQGDPCAPQLFRWEGLNCSYSDSKQPRIISLNLTESILTGNITSEISKLTQLTHLDLSKNDLSGDIPAYFADMKSLKLINLSGNPNLNRTIPYSLQQRLKSKSLILILDETRIPVTISKSKGVPIVAIVVAVAGVFALVVVVAIFFVFRGRKQKSTYGTQSIIAKDRMITYPKVDLLLRVHHRHLVRLVGYCDDGDNLALIYEYMANGDLKESMSGIRDGNVLTWGNRMKIAVEAAQGLEYLHNGCTPPIVHRDVKTTNILLNEQYGAKLADFGLSRSFPIDGESHVSTEVAGTPGYLDPEYYRTNLLRERSDVYSFGVVLLEIITNQPVIDNTRERSHINEWVGFMLTKGDIRSIVDPKLMGDYDTNVAWKIVELAMACVNPSSNQRPLMARVVVELNECVAIEYAREQGVEKIDSVDAAAMYNVSSASHLGPVVR